MATENVPSTKLRARLNHPAFPQPFDYSTKVWRYLSFPKFVSLLSTNSLFFSRVDRLNDPFEGTLPALTMSALDEVLKGQGRAEGYMAISPIYQQSRRSQYVSCWHMNDHESEAMWRLYGGSEGGVALQTTYQSLVNSIEDFEKVYIGAVSYMDYENSAFPGGNQFYPTMHKRLSFLHEQEVRMVQVCPPDLQDQTPESLGLPWSVEKYAQAIYVTPYAENYYFEAVRSVVNVMCPAMEPNLRWSRMRGTGTT